MSQFSNPVGAQYTSFFGGDGYKPNPSGGPISSALSMAGAMLAGGGGGSVSLDPFSAMGPNLAYEQQARRLNEAIQESRAASVELMRVDSQRITQMSSAILEKLQFSTLSETQKQRVQANADAFGSLASSGFGQMALGAMGINPALINPNLNLPNSAGALLNSAMRGSALSGALVGDFAAEIGKSAGIQGDGSINPAQSMGFTAVERADIARSLQARGALGLNSDQLMYSLGASGRSELAAGNPILSSNVARYMAASMNKSVQPLMGVYAEAKETLGISDPEQLTRAIQAVSGGGLSGGQSPGQVQSQLGNLRQISQAAGIAVDTLVSFIENSTALAQKAGLNPAAAASTSLRSLMGAVQSADQYSSTATLTGYGINRDPMVIAEDSQRRLMQAQASPFAGRAAVAYSALEDVANRRGMSTSEVAEQATGEQRQVLRELVNLRSGAISPYTLDALKYTDRVAGAVSSITGEDSAEVAIRLGNKALQQRALARNPSIIEGTSDMNLVERVNQQKGSLISQIAGRDLNSLEVAEVSASAVAFTGDPVAFRDDLARKAAENPMQLRNLNFLAPTRAQIREVYNKTRLPWEGATEQAWANKINQIAELATDAGVTDQQAISFNARNNVNDTRETMSGRAYAESSMANTIGGLPAIDQIIQGVRSSDSFGGALARGTGNIPRTDILSMLAASGGSNNFVENLTAASGAGREAGLDLLSSVVSGSPDQQKAFREHAAGISDPGEMRELLAGTASNVGGSSMESAIISGFTKAGDKISATITEAIIRGLSGVTIVAGSNTAGSIPFNIGG